MFKIFTFGLKITFQGENRLESLRQFILKHGITVVYDIRYDGGNYYLNWNCNSNHIAAMIRANFPRYECAYFRRPCLGISGKTRSQYQWNPQEMEFIYLNAIYERHLEREFEIENSAERILLLCVENLKDPKTPYCHRIWLRNYLVGTKLAELGDISE